MLYCRMDFVRGLHQCFVFKRNLKALYSGLSRLLACRHLCAVNLNCELPDRQVNRSPKCNSSSECDKWAEDNRVRVYRAFERLRYMRLIKAAVRVGMPFPELNPRLATLIQEMQKYDITIPTEEVIERTLNPKVRSGIYEVAAPCGILFVLQHDSVDISETEHLVREVCQRYDFTFLTLRVQRLSFYDQKGILTTVPSESEMPLERALEIAMKAGAESVSSKVGMEGKTSLEIFCNPSVLHPVKRQLENSFNIEEAFVGLIAKSLTKVPDSVKSKMADVIVDFSGISEIERIYENIK